MNGIRRLAGSLLIAVFLFSLARASFAVDILNTAETVFYDDRAGGLRAGIEVELTGISAETVADVLQKKFGGELKKATDIPTPFLFQLINSSIGTVILKEESNEISERATEPSGRRQILEIVTEPVGSREIGELQGALDELRRLGALGTSETNAVSIQVNLDVEEASAETQTRVVVDLLRSYLSPEHRRQIEDRLNVPAIRRVFVGGVSAGFKKRLLDSDYHPTPRQFFDDYLYRQSLELRGDSEAWSLPIHEARARLLSLKDPVVPEVVKLTSLRISSFLMNLFPNDPLTARIVLSGWARSGRYLEFREFNNDFDVLTAYRRSLGLYIGAKRYGYYDHDRLLSELSGMPEATIRELRAAFLSGTAPIVVRYFLGDEKLSKDSYVRSLLPYYSETFVSFFPGSRFGRKPVVIPGESIVFHRLPIHRSSVLGKYNPVLVNANISQTLENKWAEYLFWNDHVPGAMPGTRLLQDVVRPGQGVEENMRELNRQFPGGWILKGVWDLATEKEGILSSTDPLLDEYRKYLASDFDAYDARLKRDFKNDDPEDIIFKRKRHPAYKGWKIAQIFKRPHQAMVQERVDIVREFRVEVIAGQVLRNNMTVDRYYYLSKKDMTARGVATKIEDSVKDRIENWVQEKIDRLPSRLRGIPFGIDVAILKDGGIVMIESNPGGNSGFLAERPESIQGLNEFLRRYPELIIRNPDLSGLSPVEQMGFVRDFFKRHAIDPAVVYPGVKFTDDHVEDRVYQRKPVDRDRFSLTPHASSCRELLAKVAA